MNRIVGAPGSSTTNHPTPNQQERKEGRKGALDGACSRACVCLYRPISASQLKNPYRPSTPGLSTQ